jgi:hypothetical protein
VLLWSAVTVALLAAAAGWVRAGRLARRLDALNQSYWELRYDYTRLRSQLARLDPGEPADEPAPAAASGQQVTFVPLASIKKKS